MIAKIRPYLYPLLISIFSYLYFFYPLINSDIIIYSGADSIRLHYASRLYLNDNLLNEKFPFWTERMFSGYPIFSDLERGYQNLPNILLIYLFGPFNSYKIIHFLCYLLGSLSLYLLISSRLKNPLFFLPINLLYFFSFLMLIHQQHFNIVLTFYLLPLIIYITELYCKKPDFKFPIILSLIYYFIITLGSMQSVLIVLVIQLLYFLINSEKENHKIFITSFSLLTLLISAPSLYTFYQLYINSQRSISDVSGAGNLDLYLLVQNIYPFAFGIKNFLANQLNELYRKNEHSIYLGITVYLISAYTLITSKFSKTKVFSILIISFFILSNVILLPPFSLFRYWVRSEFALLFLFCLIIPEYFSLKFEKMGVKNYLLIFSTIVISFIPFLLKRDALYLFKIGVLEDISVPLLWFLLIILTVFTFIKDLKYKNYIVTFLIIFDVLIFSNKLDSNLFINKNEIYYESITTNIDVGSRESEGDYTLLYNSLSDLGYSVLSPIAKDKSELDKLQNLLSFEKLLPIYLIFYLLYIASVYTFIKFKNQIYAYFK